MHIISIDLGQNTGCMALMRKEESNISVINYIDLKSAKISKQIDFIKTGIEKYKVGHIIIEQPFLNNKNQAACVPFVQLGWFQGIADILGIKHLTLRPQVWQMILKDVDIDPIIDREYTRKDNKTTKKKSLSFIKKYHPNISYKGSRGGLKDGRADSICIGHYYLQTISNDK